MLLLKDYLRKFKNLTPPDDFTRKKVCEVVQKNTNIDLLVENVKVKRGVIFIKENNTLKNSLFLKKRKILDDLQKELGKKTPKDIR